MPQAWAHPRSAVIDGNIYLCTGYGGTGDPQDWDTHPLLAVYDPTTDTWTTRAELPFGRNDSETAVVDGRMYVMGGANAELFGRINGSPVRIPDVIVYDPATDTWTDAPPMTMPRRGHRACSVDGTIYVIGGTVGQPPTGAVSSLVEVYDVTPATNAAWPEPADGAIHNGMWAVLLWHSGIYADLHEVYLNDNFDDVNNGYDRAFSVIQSDNTLIVGLPGYPYPEGLVPGTTYYWRIDEVNDTDPNSPWIGPVWSFSIPPRTAYNPDPADGAESVDLNKVLSWTAGFDAALHTVYFGDNFDDVTNATGGSRQLPTTYHPGTLESGKTYFWRIDESASARLEVHKGDVWSFTTSFDGSN
jgi:hypothetical protein